MSSATSVTSCVAYCLPFWVHPGLLVAFVLVCFMCMLCRSLLVRLYLLFWPLCCLFFFDIRILFTTLVSFGHCAVCSSSIYGFCLPLWYLLAIVLSVLLRYTDSVYLFGIFKLFLPLLWSNQGFSAVPVDQSLVFYFWRVPSVGQKLFTLPKTWVHPQC